MQVLDRPDTAVREGVIYALCDPLNGEIRYVGKATNADRRLRAHLESGQLTRYKSHKNSWIRSLLAEGLKPEMRILESVPLEDLAEAEQVWILQCQRLGARLTNGTDGGEGGAVTDPDALARIRAAHLGVKRSDETRAKQSASRKRYLADHPDEVDRLRGLGGTPPVRPGEANNSKLTEESVKEMRRLHKEGVSGVELARRFGVTPTNVSYIVRRLAWKHVGD